MNDAIACYNVISVTGDTYIVSIHPYEGEVSNGSFANWHATIPGTCYRDVWHRNGQPIPQGDVHAVLWRRAKLAFLDFLHNSGPAYGTVTE